MSFIKLRALTVSTVFVSSLTVLAACTSDSAKTNSGSDSVAVATSEASAAGATEAASAVDVSAPTVAADGSVAVAPSAPDTSTQIKVEPGTAKDGFVGARSDVSKLTCKKASTDWVAEGIVSNSTKKAADYRIYVSFMSGTETKGLVEVDVADVEPGVSKDWDVSAALDANDVNCILRVERVKK
jgi:hypothetical protein